MVEQKLSIASLQDQQSSHINSKLIVEVSNQHIAIIEKNAQSTQAFEYYEINATPTEWERIFNVIKNLSKILSKTYSDTTVYINNSETLIVPAKKYNRESTETYLTAIYGDNNQVITNADLVNIEDNPVTVYRCAASLNHTIKNHFVSFTYKNIYTKILENLFGKERMLMEMIKVQFYQKTMLVVVIYDNKLMLIQTYNYSSPEDIIYYLLNIVQEFNLSVKSTPVEVSGLIDVSSRHFELLENIFGRLSLEVIANDHLFTEHFNGNQAHWYTPFYNLSV